MATALIIKKPKVALSLPFGMIQGCESPSFHLFPFQQIFIFLFILLIISIFEGTGLYVALTGPALLGLRDLPTLAFQVLGLQVPHSASFPFLLSPVIAELFLLLFATFSTLYFLCSPPCQINFPVAWVHTSHSCSWALLVPCLPIFVS
jgi:hypothetical protein